MQYARAVHVLYVVEHTHYRVDVVAVERPEIADVQSFEYVLAACEQRFQAVVEPHYGAFAAVVDEHQAYPHKLLTGRRKAFAEGNRKFGGISGFPNPSESDYDTFSAGHASNSISAALGMAMASQLKGENPRRNVVAVMPQ